MAPTSVSLTGRGGAPCPSGSGSYQTGSITAGKAAASAPGIPLDSASGGRGGVSATDPSQLAPVAQRIERRFPKPCVAGSSPAGGAEQEQVKVHSYAGRASRTASCPSVLSINGPTLSIRWPTPAPRGSSCSRSRPHGTHAIPMALIADRTAARRYRADLEAYLHAVVSPDGSFCCAAAAQCRPSVRPGHALAEGQLSYVGDGYVVSDGDRELRVLIVSMQVGDAEAPVSMTRRSEQVGVRVPQRPHQRNAHMRGVTYALQVLFGLEPGPGTELLDDGTHVLDAYAMANSTLCSYLPTGGKSRRGEPTRVMLDRCGAHLRRTVEILRPTIIHTQGRKISGASTHSAFEQIVDEADRLDPWNAVVRIGDVEAAWCSLPHPSTGPPQAWQWTSTPFFNEVVRPSLERARSVADGLAS